MSHTPSPLDGWLVVGSLQAMDRGMEQSGSSRGS